MTDTNQLILEGRLAVPVTADNAFKTNVPLGKIIITVETTEGHRRRIDVIPVRVYDMPEVFHEFGVGTRVHVTGTLRRHWLNAESSKLEPFAFHVWMSDGDRTVAYDLDRDTYKTTVTVYPTPVSA